MSGGLSCRNVTMFVNDITLQVIFILFGVGIRAGSEDKLNHFSSIELFVHLIKFEQKLGSHHFGLCILSLFCWVAM